MSQIIDSFIQDYINFFEQIAINHTDICHDPTCKQHAFFRMNIQELDGVWRAKVREKGVALIVIEYVSNTKSISENLYSERQGGFIITGHHKGHDAAEQLAILDKTERIAHDVMNMIVQYSKNAYPLFNCSISDWNNFYLSPMYNQADGNYAGWLVTFKFMTAVSRCINEAKWKGDFLDNEFIDPNFICP